MQHTENNLIFGLDIGTRSVVGILGYEREEGFHVVASHMEFHETRAMIDGQIHNIDHVAKVIQKVKNALEKKTNRVLKKVCIAAAGRVLETMETTVHIDIDETIDITEEQVQSLELQGIEKAMHKVNYQEHDQALPFYCVGYTVTKYYLNHFEMTHLIGHKGTSIGVDILSTFLPTEVVNSLYKVMDLVGLEVYSLTLEPIAAIHVAIPQAFRLLNIALVDIGAGTSDIAITKGGSIVAYGMISNAGDEITESIVHHYLVDFSTAEKIKIKASTKGKTVSFKDALGLTQTVDLSEVRQVIEPALQHLATMIYTKIIELNGGNATNAVFIVGGGGQIKGLTSKIACGLNILDERVALRGKDVLTQVTTEDPHFKKNPEYVTPIGICCTGLQNNQHDFIEVFFNDESIRIFNTQRLTVMDIVALKGIDPNVFIPKSGKNLSFTLNGEVQNIKGFLGEPATIYVNQKKSDLSTPISMHDYITLVHGKKGEDCIITIDNILKGSPYFILNEEKKLLDLQIFVNSTKKSPLYVIAEGDDVQIVYPTLQQVLDGFSIDYTVAFINEMEAEMSQNVYIGDQIHTFFEEVETANASQNLVEKELYITVNDQPIVLSGKEKYVFVDIFDVIDFDRSQAKGNLITTINQKVAGYMDFLHTGDYIEIYWEKER